MYQEKIENEKIVVGMTGRLDSVVAAYLLKKQGYECIAVGVVYAEGEALEYFLMRISIPDVILKI